MSFERSTIESGDADKEQKSEKEILWGQKQQEVDEIADLNGKGIDKDIKESVVAFNMQGLPTSNSCEGHVDRGLPYPFVAVEAEGEPRWHYEGQKELFEEVAKEKGIQPEKLDRSSQDWDINAYEDIEGEAGRRMNERANKEDLTDTAEYSEWKKKNKEIFERAQTLLNEYRKNTATKNIDSDTEIIMEGNEETSVTFRPKSGFERGVDAQRYIEKRAVQNRELSIEEHVELFKKLEKRRTAMNDFTAFLKKRYFES